MKTWLIRITLIGVIAVVALMSRPEPSLAVPPPDNCDRRCTVNDPCDKICMDGGVAITCNDWGICADPCFSNWQEISTVATGAYQIEHWFGDYPSCEHYTSYKTTIRDVAGCNPNDRFDYFTVYDGGKISPNQYYPPNCCDGNPWSCW